MILAEDLWKHVLRPTLKRLSEILSRDVEYFGRFPMRVASLRSQLERYEAMALFRGWLAHGPWRP